jgi:HPt (histidine-containing phosphotransfer) domain-containing protein
LSLIKKIEADKPVTEVHEEIWDKALGLKMLGGSEQLFEEVLNIYMIENKDAISELNGLYERRDYDGAGKLVHKLKSSTGTIGASKVQQIASELQKAFNTEDEGRIKTLYPHFEELFSTLLLQIKNRK